MSNINYKSLQFSEFGDYQKVITISEQSINLESQLLDHEIVVKISKAAIHPMDVNYIAGNYGIKPSLPCSAGFDGIGFVIKCGSKCSNLLNHKIYFYAQKGGSWSQYIKLNSLTDGIIELNEHTSDDFAVSFCNSAMAAYVILQDVKPNDCKTIIQNGSTSSVGLYIIQLCKIMGLRCISIVRNRPECSEVKKKLLELGSSHVIVDDEDFKETKKYLELANLVPDFGIDCVGGRSLKLMTQLIKSDSYVTIYGGMSKEKFNLSITDIVFRGLKFQGFWSVKWAYQNRDKFKKFADELIKLNSQHKFVTFCKTYDFLSFQDAFKLNETPFKMLKCILDFSD